MLKRLLATVDILRPHNMVAAGGAVVAGYVLSGGSGREIIVPFALTGFVTGFGNLINDYYDRNIDRINKPRRAIPSRRLTARYVLNMYWVGSIVITLLMFVFLPIGLFGLIVTWEILLYVYARWAKRIALLGNLMIASIAASAFVGGAIPTGNFAATGFASLLAFLLVMGRELVKGAEDVDGDRREGASTIAVRFGVGTAVYLGVVSLLLCVMISPVPALIQSYGRVYALVMELLFAPGLLVASFIVLRSRERHVLHRASSILKIHMFFGIVAMALGRL